MQSCNNFRRMSSMHWKFVKHQIKHHVGRSFRSPKEGVPEEGHMLGTVGIPTPPPRMYFIYQKPIYTHGKLSRNDCDPLLRVCNFQRLLHQLVSIMCTAWRWDSFLSIFRAAWLLERQRNRVGAVSASQVGDWDRYLLSIEEEGGRPLSILCSQGSVREVLG